MTENLEFIIRFINAPFIGAVATALTAYVAWRAYTGQVHEKKVQAARIILQEIRTAEDNISRITEQINSGSFQDLPSVLVDSSWTTYSHLFSKDLDQDHLKSFADFFNVCRRINEMVEKSNNVFWANIDEKARLVQTHYARLVIEENMAPEEAFQLVKKYQDIVYTFNTGKAIDMIRALLPQFQRLTTTPAFEKIKIMAS